jgi:Flp pilus assembly protein TadB
MNPFWVTLIFGIGLLLVGIGYSPERFLSPFSRNHGESLKVTSRQRFQRKLRLAGYYDQSPSFFLVGMILAGLVVGFLLGAAISIYLIPLGPVLVSTLVLWHLGSREKNAVARASDEIIPFLRNIEAAVRAQQAAPMAYRRAVEKTKTLRPYLEPSVAQMISGVSFSEALHGTVERLPLRTWSIFVRQMELHERSGGPLADAIASTVRHLDMIIQLQSDARAQYASQAWQMRIITGISVGGTLVFGLLISPDITILLFTTFMGYIALAVGLSVMAGGLWFGRKQLSAIARKLNF